MITVLHIAYSFPPGGLGTAQRIFHSQPREGFAHHVVIPTLETRETYTVDPCFVVHPVRLFDLHVGKASTFLGARRMGAEAVRIIQSEDIDVLYAHSPVMCARAMTHVTSETTGLPMVYEPHIFLQAAYLKKIMRYRHERIRGFVAPYFRHMLKTERRLLSSSDAVICQTEALRDKMRDLYPDEMPEAIIAPNGMPEDMLPAGSIPASVRDQLPEKPFVFFGGHLTKANGVGRILDVASDAPDVPIVIAGDGPYAAQAAGMARTNDSFTYLGNLHRSDYFSVLSSAKVVVSLRQKTTENDVFLPLKALDAMALGKLFLTTDLSIMREISLSYTGIEFVPDDTPSISGRLRELLEQGMPGEHDGRFLSKTAKKPYRWTTTQAVLAAHLSGLCS